MSRNRTAAALVTASLLVGALPATAYAEPDNPLYRLVDTAAQRLATADPVAAAKWINGGPITDPARADQVLDAVGADATAHGVDAGYVRAIFTDQIAGRNSLHGPACQTEIQEATDAVADARALDPLYRQALSSATRSYCIT